MTGGTFEGEGGGFMLFEELNENLFERDGFTYIWIYLLKRPFNQQGTSLADTMTSLFRCTIAIRTRVFFHIGCCKCALNEIRKDVRSEIFNEILVGRIGYFCRPLCFFL